MSGRAGTLGSWLTSALALALLASLAPGCARPRRPVVVPADAAFARWNGPPPGPSQTRQAVGWLLSELPTWPEGVSRSRDFPELALVDARPVEDRAELGADAALLLRTLEESVRAGGQLRLVADELAVPAFLREDPPAEGEPPRAQAEPAAGGAGEPLVLESWVAADGRLHLVLSHRGVTLVAAESARAREP